MTHTYQTRKRRCQLAEFLRGAGARARGGTVEVSEDGIEQVLWMMNPDKLAAAVAVTK
jgi:hypothetical protein